MKRVLIPIVAVGFLGAGLAYAQTSPGTKLDCDVVTSTATRLSLDCTEVTPSTSTTVPASTTTSVLPTTTSAAPGTTTTTTVAPSSTTSPPSSTTSSTTSTSTSTTQPVPSTTQPPGVAFSEDFAQPSAVGRFNLDVGNYVDANGHRTADYIAQGGDTPRLTHGDHNMACGAPTTLRDIDNADRNNATLNSRYFWYCAPNGPDTGHFMSGLDTTGYAVVSFSPAQTFSSVTKVCWDINATDEGGGKWTNMIIVPEALFRQFYPRMDYVAPGFNGGNGPGDFNIQQSDHPSTKVFGVRDFRGTQFVYSGDDVLAHPDGDTARVTADKAARYRHCLERTSSTTARLTVARPAGGDSSYSVNVGAAWPSGPVRVIFQDEMYDPPKRAGYDPTHVTWHLDNITIS